MKRTILMWLPMLALVMLLVVSTLTACSRPNQAETKVVEDTPSMFVIVEHGYSWRVVYHKDTKVMYAVSDGSYNYGSFTVLLNPDGTPMLWQDE